MRRATKQADVLNIVEAAYRIEQSTSEWLRGILAAATPALDCGFGVAVHCYDASDPSRFRPTSLMHHGLPPGFAEPFADSFGQLDANVRESYRSRSCCALASEIRGWNRHPFVRIFGERFGVCDSVTVNGVNPDGHGCALLSLAGKGPQLSSRRRGLLSKLSCHLAAAVRLRQRLSAPNVEAPEAVLDFGGKVHHASGDARSKSALSDLRDSAVAISKARGPLRKRDPERAVEEWKGLIAARWTLLEVSESDGRKYLVARQNEPRTRGPNAFTAREQQVAALAALGQDNKLIAYNLGVSHSTVRVLIARAAAKLGAGSRDLLVRSVRANDLPGGDGPA